MFKGRQFEREIIILCERWYLRFELSFRDLVEMMAECGVSFTHTTIMCWVPFDIRVRDNVSKIPHTGWISVVPKIEFTGC